MIKMLALEWQELWVRFLFLAQNFPFAHPDDSVFANTNSTLILESFANAVNVVCWSVTS